MEYNVIDELLRQSYELNIQIDIVFYRTTAPAGPLISNEELIKFEMILDGQLIQAHFQLPFSFGNVDLPYIRVLSSKFGFKSFDPGKLPEHPVLLAQHETFRQAEWHSRRHSDPNTLNGLDRYVHPLGAPASFD